PNRWIGQFPGPTAGGDWSDPTGWSLGRVPGPSDLVTIDIGAKNFIFYSGGPTDAVLSLDVIGGTFFVAGGSLAVNATSHLDNLEIRGGRLEGSGDLTINKSLLLSSGVLSGAGQTIIPTGATFELR